MGIVSFLGNVAKGYIEERGVQGTIEDVATLGKKLFGEKNEVVEVRSKGSRPVKKRTPKTKSSSSSENTTENNTAQNNNQWNDMIAKCQDRVNEGDYKGAINVLDEYYNNMYYYGRDQRDYAYYNNKAIIYQMWLNNIHIDDELYSSLLMSYSGTIGVLCHKFDCSDEEKSKEVEAFRKDFEEKNNEKEFVKKWKTGWEKIEKMEKKENFSAAYNLVVKLFQDLDLEKDAGFYSKICWYQMNILKDYAFDTKEYREQESMLDEMFLKYKDVCTTDENIETYNSYFSVYEECKLSSNVEACIMEKDFSEAKRYLNLYRKKFPKDDITYWRANTLTILFELFELKKTDLSFDTIQQQFLFAMNEYESCCVTEDDKEGLMKRQYQYQDFLERLEAEDKTGYKLSDNEQEYIDEYNACLEDDGQISEKERRLLDKLCKSLGISKERAIELEREADSTIAFSSDEQEYFDEYKNCLNDDGTITDKERRLLNKLANSLNITMDRVMEIEAMANKL